MEKIYGTIQKTMDMIRKKRWYYSNLYTENYGTLICCEKKYGAIPKTLKL